MTTSPSRPLDRLQRWLARWRSLMPIFLAEFVILLGFGALLPVLPLYVTGQGIDVGTYGLITAAWAIAKLISEPIFGAFADRTRLHRVQMVSGLALLSVFMLLPLLFTSAAALFVLRLLAGAAAGMYDPAARGLIVDRTSESERGEAFGLYNAFQMGGFLVGPVIGALGTALGGGLGFPFVLTGLLTVSAAAYLAYAMRGQDFGKPTAALAATKAAVPPDSALPLDPPLPVDGTASPNARTAGGTAVPPLSALFNATFISAVVIYFGVSLSFGVYEVVWTLFMLHLGASLEWVGATFSMFGIGVVIVSPFAGRIIDRIGAMRFTVLGCLAIALSGFLYVLSTEPVFPSIVVPFEAVAEAFVTPALFVLVAAGTPEGRSSTAQGIFGAAGTVALIVASLTAGVLYEGDPVWPFLFFIGGILVTLAIGAGTYAMRHDRATRLVTSGADA